MTGKHQTGSLRRYFDTASFHSAEKPYFLTGKSLQRQLRLTHGPAAAGSATTKTQTNTCRGQQLYSSLLAAAPGKQQQKKCRQYQCWYQRQQLTEPCVAAKQKCQCGGDNDLFQLTLHHSSR